MALHLVAGGMAFLALHRGQDHRSHFISLHTRFEEALARWGPGSRVSPVFAAVGSRAVSLHGNEPGWLTFLGPLFPGSISPDEHPAIFLSLGLFNVLLFSSSNHERTRAREVATRHGASWEEWSLQGERLLEIEFSQTSPATRISPPLGRLPGDLPEALSPVLREYSTLIATSLGRTPSAVPDFADDIRRFDLVFRGMLADPEAHITTKLGQLVKGNAALSRFTSQTLTGTSPILETESHYWTHSLLGIGIASLALWRIRQFVEKAYALSRFEERLDALRTVEPAGTPLTGLSSRDPFWDIDHLFDHAAQSTIPKDDPIFADRLPLITYFSGGDGFRSTNVSLSAPLEVVSSCNATSWTPLTLTHEISHQIIEDALGAVLPNPDDLKYLQKVVDVLNGQNALNLLRQLEAFLCYAVWRMEDAEEDRRVELH